ncbi:hypothetical protein [Alteribacter keqinensis]|uniref:Uncharacterized protein n=1 Tax=Alteribacter keqinensis TaxID=2483800 RepID=A0A3M7TUN2_9BACI|nr:hypothetical protein [Alteribacter keqinensis]RNA69350.1 hypothetical protein EBO34_05260 [Alteribacter keqinensis]
MDTKPVLVYHNAFTQPEKNAILTGMILPFGDGVYTTTTDFLHSPLKASKPTAIDIKKSSQQYISSGYDPLFIEKYPELLTLFLKHLKNGR